MKVEVEDSQQICWDQIKSGTLVQSKSDPSRVILVTSVLTSETKFYGIPLTDDKWFHSTAEYLKSGYMFFTGVLKLSNN